MSSASSSVPIEARLPKAIRVVLAPLLKLIVFSTRMLWDVDERIFTSRDPPSNEAYEEALPRAVPVVLALSSIRRSSGSASTTALRNRTFVELPPPPLWQPETSTSVANAAAAHHLRCMKPSPSLFGICRDAKDKAPGPSGGWHCNRMSAEALPATIPYNWP